MLEAEDLLGRRVLDGAGCEVGVVLDVGTGEHRAAKFLLVGASEGERVVRVEIRDVARLDGDALRLRPLLGAA
jgi:sporulation protein YlmC with PRC-barrel domain